MEMRLVDVSEQGVGGGAHPFLLAAILRLNHNNGDEEEDGCYERGQIDGWSHFGVRGALGC